MTLSDQILKEFQDTLTRFKEDENKWENHTKAEYIKKCDELITAQVEAGIINIELSGISSYLYGKLSDFGISVSDKTIQNNLPDNHKRNYIKTETTSDYEQPNFKEIETEDPTITLEKDQFNDIKINGVEYQPKREPRQKEEPKVESKPIPETDQFKYLTAMSKLANKFHLTFETLKNRYTNDAESQEIIDKELGNVKAKLEEYARQWANIENSKGMIDLRRSYGEYEKMMGTFVIETGETIARIAQIMEYSEKYGSIGLLREPKVREFFETVENYPLYLRSCPACLADISTIMNHNIALYRECKDLTVDIPVIQYKHINIQAD